MPKASAADRARRLLALLHYFEPGAEIPLDAIAAALDTTTDEIAADLELLACCGVAPYTPEALLPIYLEQGNVVVWGELPALDRRVRLSRREAHALSTALGAAGIGEDHHLARKLEEAASTAGDGEQAATLLRAGSAGDSEHVQSLMLALERRLLVRLQYQSAQAECETSRIAEPMGLVHERGSWYLEAFCRKAGAVRTFRLDRVRALDLLEERFEPRALSPTGAALVVEGLPEALVKLDPGEEFSERDWPGARVVDKRADGGITVAVPYAGSAWIARQVVARQGGATLLSPPELRLAVAEMARAALSELGLPDESP